MRRSYAVNAIIILLLLTSASAVVGAQPQANVVTVNVKDTPFPEVIRAIFSGHDKSYSVDPALDQVKVTINIKMVSWSEAIQVVTRAAGVEYRVSNNTYIFKPGPTVIEKGPAKTVTGATKLEVVPLKYITPGDAASLLNATAPEGLVSITATNTNKLLIKGTAQAIADAKNLIAQFDDESALPRAVRLSATLEITGIGATPLSLKSESVGPEAIPMQLGINSTGNQSVGAAGVSSYSYLIDLKLTPTVLSDGTISLTGSGGIDCNIPYSASNSILLSRLSRSFEVAVSATAGQPVVVASASGTGAGDAGFTISVTATIGKGRIAAPGGERPSAGAAAPDRGKGKSSRLVKADDAQVKAADALLQQIWEAKPGQAKFDAIDAVVKSYKKSDLATRNAIGWVAANYMLERSRPMIDRWPCCYVITSAGYENGFSDVIEVLLQDPIEMMRAVAAEALGVISDNPIARDALVKARSAEKSELVLTTIAKYIK